MECVGGGEDWAESGVGKNLVQNYLYLFFNSRNTLEHIRERDQKGLDLEAGI